MAVGMQQYQIVQLVPAPLVPLHHMVDVPPGFPGNELLARRAALALPGPERLQLPPTLRRFLPETFQPLLEIGLELRGVRIRFRLDLGMPLDRHIAGIEQIRSLAAGILSLEDPLTLACWREVLSLDPALAPAQVPSLAPLPQHLPDAVVHIVERLLGRNSPMVVGPAPNHRVELIHDPPGRHGLVGVQQLPY